jgi:hypothetical protein
MQISAAMAFAAVLMTLVFIKDEKISHKKLENT